MIDSRRRLVMPPELPARSAVTIQQIDDDTWLVKRARPSKTNLAGLPADIKKLPHHPEWEAVEERIAAHSVKNLPPFEE